MDSASLRQDTWPNNQADFVALYQAHLAEYEALRKRPAWSLSAAADDRKRVLRQKLVCMESNPWARGLPAAA